jgi:hypothetical protein
MNGSLFAACPFLSSTLPWAVSYAAMRNDFGSFENADPYADIA